MITIFIGVLFGALAGYGAAVRWDCFWGVVCGLVVFLAVISAMSLLIRRKLQRINQSIQQVMSDGQNKINRQYNMFQRRQPSSVREAQEILNKIQKKIVEDALKITEEFQPYYKWNIMLERQTSTMKLHLYNQLRDFKKVDELLPRSLLLDQLSLSIKLARMYKNKTAGIDKFYRRKCSRLKGENAAFVASVYAWIEIQLNNPAAALEALRRAAKTSDNNVLQTNIDALVNGKIKHFSNGGFGDMWYQLWLEEPKVKAQRNDYGRTWR